MKFILFTLLTLFSLQAFPGDKGNVIGPIVALDTSTLDNLLALSWEVEDSLYVPLSQKKLNVSKVKTNISSLEKLQDEKLTGKFVSVLNELISRGENEIIAALTSESELFYAAFTTLDLKKEILLNKDLSSLDKKTLSISFDEAYISFWIEVKESLSKSQSKAKVDRFFAKINWMRLGYVIH